MQRPELGSLVGGLQQQWLMMAAAKPVLHAQIEQQSANILVGLGLTHQPAAAAVGLIQHLASELLLLLLVVIQDQTFNSVS
jgi:hypothetical protein